MSEQHLCASAGCFHLRGHAGPHSWNRAAVAPPSAPPETACLWCRRVGQPMIARDDYWQCVDAASCNASIVAAPPETTAPTATERIGGEDEFPALAEDDLCDICGQLFDLHERLNFPRRLICPVSPVASSATPTRGNALIDGAYERVYREMTAELAASQQEVERLRHALQTIKAAWWHEPTLVQSCDAALTTEPR